MLFQSKLERARDVQRRARGLDADSDAERLKENLPVEKGDMGAMLLSGFLTLFLPACAVLGGIVFLAMALFGAL